MIDRNGRLREWGRRTNTSTPDWTKSAYDKLLHNLDLAKGGFVHTTAKKRILVCELEDGEKGLVWEFEVPLGLVCPKYLPRTVVGQPLRTFLANNGILDRAEPTVPLGDCILKWIIAGLLH